MCKISEKNSQLQAPWSFYFKRKTWFLLSKSLYLKRYRIFHGETSRIKRSETLIESKLYFNSYTYLNSFQSSVAFHIGNSHLFLLLSIWNATLVRNRLRISKLNLKCIWFRWSLFCHPVFSSCFIIFQMYCKLDTYLIAWLNYTRTKTIE